MTENVPLSRQFSDAFDLPHAPHVDLPENKLVAIVLAYNEGLRFPHFLDFHRAIGVGHFLVVDNNSDDGSAGFLDAQNDVTRFPSSKPYSHYKTKWREILADLYLDNKWAFFPDVDELLVYPGWPDISINTLTSHWHRLKYQGVFTSMIDLYPKAPLSEVRYQRGAPFLDFCPFFDDDDYSLMPMKWAYSKKFKTPRKHIFGGARERLFDKPLKHQQRLIDKFILKYFFSLNEPLKNGYLAAQRNRFLAKIIKDALPELAPLMSKVPLIFWQKGLGFSGGVHNVRQDIKLTPDWGALLHFKYLDDFQQRIEEASDRGQHSDGSKHYKVYQRRKQLIIEQGAMYEGSVEFNGTQSLISRGLLRISPELNGLITGTKPIKTNDT